MQSCGLNTCCFFTQLVSPLKKVFVQGEVTSVDPYIIRLANRYDDNDVIQSDITVDAGKRSIVFQTSYDIGETGLCFTLREKGREKEGERESATPKIFIHLKTARYISSK